MHQQLRSCKSHVDRLKSRLDRTKLIGQSQQELNAQPEQMTAVRKLIGPVSTFVFNAAASCLVAREYDAISETAG